MIQDVGAEVPCIRLCGIPIHAITEQAVIRRILHELDAGRGGWVITHNLDHVRRRLRDPDFAEICSGATLVVADGMPLVWASRIQDTPLPERVAGSNLTVSLTGAAAEHGRSVFLLGGTPGAAIMAAATLRAKYPRLQVAGTSCPPKGFELDADKIERVRSSIVDAAPDIVYVALGSPKQEQLIRRIRDARPTAWWLGVGISFSFVSGALKRAPRWMQRCGLEWVHRLGQEPRRLGRRYLVDGVPFALRLLTVSAWIRVRHVAPTASERG